jgi:hypothetical protein
VAIDPGAGPADWLRLFRSEGPSRGAVPASPLLADSTPSSQPSELRDAFASEEKPPERPVVPHPVPLRISERHAHVADALPFKAPPRKRAVRMAQAAAGLLVIAGLAGAAVRTPGWIPRRAATPATLATPVVVPQPAPIADSGTSPAISVPAETLPVQDEPSETIDIDAPIVSRPAASAEPPRTDRSAATVASVPAASASGLSLSVSPLRPAAGRLASNVPSVVPRADIEVPAGQPATLRASATASSAETLAVERPAAVSIAPSPEEALAAETGEIKIVLSRYQNAFNALDAGEAKAIWPGVDDKSLGRAFGQLESQHVVFDACQIEVDGTRATSTCDGRASYVPKIGSKTARIDSRNWTFELVKTERRGWMIEGVRSR